tara:strand:- start:379 stop:693 length:315 start_codon:yes stop_codon:yes gene_type:complete
VVVVPVVTYPTDLLLNLKVETSEEVMEGEGVVTVTGSSTTETTTTETAEIREETREEEIIEEEQEQEGFRNTITTTTTEVVVARDSRAILTKATVALRLIYASK